MHFATLTSEDVVRHSLVAKIVDAYTKYEDAKNAKQASKKVNKQGCWASESLKGQKMKSAWIPEHLKAYTSLKLLASEKPVQTPYSLHCLKAFGAQETFSETLKFALL